MHISSLLDFQVRFAHITTPKSFCSFLTRVVCRLALLLFTKMIGKSNVSFPLNSSCSLCNNFLFYQYRLGVLLDLLSHVFNCQRIQILLVAVDHRYR